MYKDTEKGKKWIGVEYHSEEYFKALANAVDIFNEEFCHMSTTYEDCLESYIHDGDEDLETGIKYAVGLYCMGNCDWTGVVEGKKTMLEDIQIGIITDGKCKLGWFYAKDEPYKRGLAPERQFGFAVDPLPIDCSGAEIREDLLKPKVRK